MPFSAASRTVAVHHAALRPVKAHHFRTAYDEASCPLRVKQMSPQPLDPVDAAWYHMDGPANPAVVTAVAVTVRPLEFAKVRAAFEQRLLRFERFRQRVVERGLLFNSPSWEDVTDFDIDRHVHRAALPAAHDESALLDLVSELASRPLDHALPLWQVHVVERVGTGSAVIFRYHHCIGDGAAMMAVSERLFEHPRRSANRQAAKAASATPPGLLDLAFGALGAASSLVEALLKWPDPRSPFKGEFATSQRVAWSKPVPIADAKTIGVAAGAKVNDVLVAATAGALRSYLQARGMDPRRDTLRAMVPVNLRPADRVGQLGNEFGLVILDLPVAPASSARRLALAKSRMDALKRSKQAVAIQSLFKLFGRGPKALEDLASIVFGSKASVVLTNVIGPHEKMRLAGVPIERMMFCVPHPGNELGMGVSILSYCGHATLTVVADAKLVPDPGAITQAFAREFEVLLRQAKRRRVSVSRPRERRSGAFVDT